MTEAPKTEMKVITNWSRELTREQRASYNEYKNAYVKERRLKNLEAEKERQAAYMRAYRAKKRMFKLEAKLTKCVVC